MALRYRIPVLSQSEDQNRTHPALIFAHLMSTQVRASDLKTVRSAHCSDPQIATDCDTRADPVHRTVGRSSRTLH